MSLSRLQRVVAIPRIQHTISVGREVALVLIEHGCGWGSSGRFWMAGSGDSSFASQWFTLTPLCLFQICFRCLAINLLSLVTHTLFFLSLSHYISINTDVFCPVYICIHCYNNGNVLAAFSSKPCLTPTVENILLKAECTICILFTQLHSQCPLKRVIQNPF